MTRLARLKPSNLSVGMGQQVYNSQKILFSVRDEHVALDIVQDSMMKLVENYASKPMEELPLLFQRILQNTTHDYYRRQKTRSLWTTLFSSFYS